MSLMERAKNILLQPKTEWPVIEGEHATTGSLYTSYVIPLAAIGPIASVIGRSVVGIQVPPFGSFRYPFTISVRYAATMYILELASVFVLGLIIDALIPTFGGTKNQVQAMKVAAYSYTSLWLGDVFKLLPSLEILGPLAGLYGMYLAYLGLPILMKAPEDKVAAYSAVVGLVAVVLFLITNAIVSQFVWHPGSLEMFRM